MRDKGKIRFDNKKLFSVAIFCVLHFGKNKTLPFYGDFRTKGSSEPSKLF